MNKVYKPISEKHKRFPLLKPFGWLILYLLIFEHIPGFPSWAAAVFLTLLAVGSFAVWTSWIGAEDTRELFFEKDGTVKWRYEKSVKLDERLRQ